MHNFQRDGTMAHNHLSTPEQISGVNFYPNEESDLAEPQPHYTEPAMPILGEAWIKAYDTQNEDNFTLAGDLFRLMSKDQKEQLVNNIAGGLSHASRLVQDKNSMLLILSMAQWF